MIPSERYPKRQNTIPNRLIHYQCTPRWRPLQLSFPHPPHPSPLSSPPQGLLISQPPPRRSNEGGYRVAVGFIGTIYGSPSRGRAVLRNARTPWSSPPPPSPKPQTLSTNNMTEVISYGGTSGVSTSWARRGRFDGRLTTRTRKDWLLFSLGKLFGNDGISS